MPRQTARRRGIRPAAFALWVALGAACAPPPEAAQDESAAALAQAPPPVADAFRHLDREIRAEGRDTLRATPPGQMVRYHMDLGMYLRNELGLWRGGPLQEWFRARGVRHPDNMSVILLEAYGQYLRGDTVNLDSIVDAVPHPPELAPPHFEVLPPDSSGPGT